MRQRFLIVILAATSATSVLNAQRLSQWDGVYTAAQATRGEAMYKERCVTCHSEDLGGAPNYPALVGRQFGTNWNDLELSQLFTQVKVNMPQDKPGSLTPEQSIDLVAFILQKGGAPAGSAELSTDEEKLKAVLFKATRPAAPAAGGTNP